MTLYPYAVMLCGFAAMLVGVLHDRHARRVLAEAEAIKEQYLSPTSLCCFQPFSARACKDRGAAARGETAAPTTAATTIEFNQ